MRVYLERYEPDPARQLVAAEVGLAPLIPIAAAIADIERITGRSAPSVIA